MSLPICTSCLARLRISSTPVPLLPTTAWTAASSFHSSAAQRNVVKKAKVMVVGTKVPKLRESRSARIKKKSKDRPKPPPVGERKTQRKRIVLSNTNAIEINNHANLTIENMADAEQIGEVLALDGPLLDQLRDAKAFKTTQNWNMFRTPSTLIRSETVECALDMEEVSPNQEPRRGVYGLSTGEEQRESGPEAKDKENAKIVEHSTSIQQPPTFHKLVTGPKASGKSIHMVQAMSMAYLKKWIVINIPDCQEYVFNQSAYAPVPKADEQSEQMFVQPQLASDLLSRLAHSNDKVLSSLRPIFDHSATLSKTTTSKLKSLKDLALLGVNDYRLAPQVWDAVWKELTSKSEKELQQSKRPPLLIAIDGVNHWMGPTRYKSPEYKPIHAQQFTLVKQFLDVLFPTTENILPQGGIIMACTTKSNHLTSTTFDYLTQAMEHRQKSSNTSQTPPPRLELDLAYTDPYRTKLDQRVWGLSERMQYTDVINLKGLSRPESKGLLEYFAQSGIFKEAVTDGAVAEKWSLSGGGIVGELCKLGTRVRTGIFETGRREGVKMRV